MSDGTQTRTVVVTNRQGLHMRPATKIAQTAAQFQSKIEMIRGDTRVNCRSMMDITLLVAEQGTELTVEATGPDAEAAIEAIATLVAGDFEEHDEGQKTDS